MKCTSITHPNVLSTTVLRKLTILVMLFLIMPVKAAILADMNVELESIYPDPLMPGDSGLVTFTIKNEATSTASTDADQAIKIEVDTVIVSGCANLLGTVEDLDLGTIEPGKSRDMSFDVTPCEDLTLGALRF